MIITKKRGSHDVVASAQQLADLIPRIEAADRVAIDIEADSLHSYREKLCLIQISVPGAVAVAGIVDAGREQRESRTRRDYPPSRSYGGTRPSRLPVRDFFVDPLAGGGPEAVRGGPKPRGS